MIPARDAWVVHLSSLPPSHSFGPKSAPSSRHWRAARHRSRYHSTVFLIELPTAPPPRIMRVAWPIQPVSLDNNSTQLQDEYTGLACRERRPRVITRRDLAWQLLVTTTRVVVEVVVVTRPHRAPGLRRGPCSRAGAGAGAGARAEERRAVASPLWRHRGKHVVRGDY